MLYQKAKGTSEFLSLVLESDPPSYLVFAVYRPSENTTCNVHGTKDMADIGQCLCKKGYRGKLCNYCDFFDNYYVFDGLEGQIDLVSGNGAKCTCKYLQVLSQALKLHLHLFHKVKHQLL